MSEATLESATSDWRTLSSSTLMLSAAKEADDDDDDDEKDEDRKCKFADFESGADSRGDVADEASVRCEFKAELELEP